MLKVSDGEMEFERVRELVTEGELEDDAKSVEDSV